MGESFDEMLAAAEQAIEYWQERVALLQERYENACTTIAEKDRQLADLRALCGRAARIPAIVREIEDHRQAHRWAEKNDASAILDEELDRFEAASKGGEG